MTRTERLLPKWPRTTEEFVAFRRLGVDGLLPVGATVAYAVVPEYDQPTAWTPADELEGMLGFMLDGPTLGRGVFHLFIRITSTPERPVIDAGYFRLT
jgi:hypothetical protein